MFMSCLINIIQFTCIWKKHQNSKLTSLKSIS